MGNAVGYRSRSSVMTYSRDALVAAQKDVAKMLQAIRSKDFSLDTSLGTRSGCNWLLDLVASAPRMDQWRRLNRVQQVATSSSTQQSSSTGSILLLLLLPRRSRLPVKTATRSTRMSSSHISEIDLDPGIFTSDVASGRAFCGRP